MRITYQLVNSPTPITIQHGGAGGVQALSFDIGGNTLFLMYNFLFTPGITLITANEKLIAVYGARLLKPTIYGDHKYVTRINLRYFSSNLPYHSVLSDCRS
jgi:hypothetical protein